MIRTVLSLAAIMLMVATIVFGVIQLNITVVRADGCPSGPAQAQMSNCGGCNLVSATSSGCEPWQNCQTRWLCVYSCWGCPGPGGEPMQIEQTVEVYD